MALNEAERKELNELLAAGRPLPEKWLPHLFPNARREAPIGKEYRLVYAGKLSREEVLAQTPAAPWQHVRSYCTDRPHEDGWKNLLVWGDNLLALRELLADQQGPDRYGTKGKIKLIYIDPPFATKQDFMKDKEKAYQDKVIGAQFIEFLRRRLILLRELLADDGSLYVHLDTKKGHYIKAIMDEVFDETRFRNEIIWKRQSAHSDSGKCGAIHDTIYFYSKGDSWTWNDVRMPVSEDYIEAFFDQVDEATGRRYSRGDLTAAGITKGGDSGKPWRGIDVSAKGRHWALPEDTLKRLGVDKARSVQEKLDALDAAGALHWPKKGVPRLKRFADEVEGVSLQDVWTDIKLIHNQSSERIGYPTQKPEELVARIVRAASNEGDIVLDAFSGSGTTAAVAEKLGRRWIAMDCGKLSMYMTQQRLFGLTTTVGSPKKDTRNEGERVSTWGNLLRGHPGLLLITERARKGECEVTLDLLLDMAQLVKKHDLLKKDASFALACPANKLRIPEEAFEPASLSTPARTIVVGGMVFQIAFVEPKEKTVKDEVLPAKEFALYRAGLYDMDTIKALPWEHYRPFVMQLFGVRDHQHKRYGFNLDGYIGTHSVALWNYPDNKNLSLDHDYVGDLHRALRGKTGERFYVIAPVTAMAFAEDEVAKNGATYVFLKVPLSILMRLIQQKEPAAFKQPAKEEDVNAVIDAVGFDFISQPQVSYRTKKESRSGEMFPEYVLEITEFRAKTLATDLEDFENFETFSMAMMDLDYNGDVFHLSKMFWGEDLINAAGGLDKATHIEIRLTEEEFTGKQAMVILCDRYGNEKALLLSKKEFGGTNGSVSKKATVKRKAAK